MTAADKLMTAITRCMYDTNILETPQSLSFQSPIKEIMDMNTNFEENLVETENLPIQKQEFLPINKVPIFTETVTPENSEISEEISITMKEVTEISEEISNIKNDETEITENVSSDSPIKTELSKTKSSNTERETEVPELIKTNSSQNIEKTEKSEQISMNTVKSEEPEQELDNITNLTDKNQSNPEISIKISKTENSEILTDSPEYTEIKVEPPSLKSEITENTSEHKKITLESTTTKQETSIHSLSSFNIHPSLIIL
jgi:hypothetical protein